jgi:adenine deaminase
VGFALDASPTPAEGRRLSPGISCQQHGDRNVIGVIENQAPTRHLRLPVEVQTWPGTAGRFERDLAKVALVERHRGTGAVQVGLVQGLALASRARWPPLWRTTVIT